MVETKAGPREIADVAGLSLPTVKKHVHLIFRKLEVTSRSQLIALMRSGIGRDLLGLRSALMAVHAIVDPSPHLSAVFGEVEESF